MNLSTTLCDIARNGASQSIIVKTEKAFTLYFCSDEFGDYDPEAKQDYRTAYTLLMQRLRKIAKAERAHFGEAEKDELK